MLVVLALSISEIKGPDFKHFILLPFEPTEHGMIVCLPDQVFMGPDFIGVENNEWFSSWIFDRKLEVGKFEGVVIVSSTLLDAEGGGVREDMDGALVCFFMFELKGDIDLLIGFEVPNFEARFSG